jgi:hypothetical protein
MKTGHYTPEQASVNLDIEKIESEFFTNEKNIAIRRGKAFHYLCLATACDIDLNDIIEEDIVDGKDEEGIDIIFIKELNNEMVVNIFNCKSSFKDNFSSNDLALLRTGLQYIFEEPNTVVQKLSNIKLKNKIESIRGNHEKIKNINVYYCVFNGSTIEPNVKQKKHEIESRYKKFIKVQYPYATFKLELLDSSELFRIKSHNLESLRGVEVKVPYYDTERIARPEISTDDGIKGYITTIRAEEIAKLVHQYGDKLFEKNIRGWLRFNKKNQEIYDSCKSDESGLFWFLNNGITIIGDKVVPSDHLGVWKVTNLQIVNGQQTARMIFEAWNEKLLKKNVTVMCRIYESSESSFITKITKATNSQSSIGSRDLMSNDPKQLAIQKYFYKLGYFYERQRGEKKPLEEFKMVITSLRLAQVSLGILCKRPSLARKNIEDNFFNPQKYYTQIFDRHPNELVLAYLLYKYCDELKNESDEISYFGVLHIARIMWEYLADELKKDIENSIKYFESGEIKVKKESNRALQHLTSLIKNEITDKSAGNYLSRIEVDEYIFKSFTS